MHESHNNLLVASGVTCIVCFYDLWVTQTEASSGDEIFVTGVRDEKYMNR